MLRRVARVVLAMAVVAGVGGVAFMSGRRAVSTSPKTPEVAARSLIVASTSTLVDQRPVRVTARWDSSGEVLHRLSGTITKTLLADGRVSIEAGAELFRVDQVPVIAVPGAVPAFRDMNAGTRGDDVAQIQAFLVSQGTTDLVVDGKWEAATTRAWQAWQKARGYSPQSGVALGTIMFFERFPVTVAAAKSQRVGSLINAGDVALSVLDPTPRFTLISPAGSLAPPPEGAAVALKVGDKALEFTVSASRAQAADGTIETALQTTGPLVCEVWCKGLAAEGPTPLSAIATIAGPATGVTIPLGVIRTEAQDKLFVVDSSGAERPITIVLQVGSNAVVEGLEAGVSIEVPATVGR
jgi:hypothetical protein